MEISRDLKKTPYEDTFEVVILQEIDYIAAKSRDEST